jgi:hypothetical protein
VRQLRERNYTGKIVLISAHLSPHHIDAYKQLGVDKIAENHFLPKNCARSSPGWKRQSSSYLSGLKEQAAELGP